MNISRFSIAFGFSAMLFSQSRSLAIQDTIDDFTRLNKTSVTNIVSPENYSELRSVIAEARQKNLKLSIAGARHSQGGHAFCQDAIVIDTKKLNNILSFDDSKKIVTVQSGVTWDHLQEYLNPKGFAVKTMQFANVFTIGGSLSVNANGVDPRLGPLIQTIQAIRIMVPSGTILHASRTENAELFKLAVGGYGLFGVIIEADIEVTENTIYKRFSSMIPLSQYADFVKDVRNDPAIGFHFAHLHITPNRKKLFSNILAITYKKHDKALSKNKQRMLSKLYYEPPAFLRKPHITCLRGTRWAKSWQIIPELCKHGHLISRNNLMRPPIKHLYANSSSTRDLLQEYFIPINGIDAFIKALEKLTLRYNINLMHVALRFIPSNNESFLAYDRSDCIGVVLYFSQKHTDKATHNTLTWTQTLIEKAIALNGTYYLPIQLHATKKHLTQAYPTIDAFFDLKKKYDPSELFINCFYQKYALPSTALDSIDQPQESVFNKDLLPTSSKPITILIHGTCLPLMASLPGLSQQMRTPSGLCRVSSLNDWYHYARLARLLNSGSRRRFPLDNAYVFGWSGALSFKERKKAAESLYHAIRAIRNDPLSAKTPITLITVSHGGNVALNLAALTQEHNDTSLKINRLILLCCPVQDATQEYVNAPLFERVFHLYSSQDLIQIIDPQGFYAEDDTGHSASSFFSERIFKNAHSHVIQAEIRRRRRSLAHVDFAFPYFIKRLPIILKKLERRILAKKKSNKCRVVIR